MDKFADTFHTDIKQNSVFEKFIPPFLIPYSRLARWDRPIGVWLLLFPCLWSLFLAAGNFPSPYHIFLYCVGAILMRGAGCTYNDLVDSDLDAKVDRTQVRPIPAKMVTKKQALGFLVLQLGLAFLVLLQLPISTIVLGWLSLGLVFTYPWMKRVSYWPQAFLGLTFNWGALMGWSTEQNSLSWPAFALYSAGFFWTLVYDTIYAHQDREDDLLVGIKSTAIKFGANTKAILSLCAFLFVGLLGFIGSQMEMSPFYYVGLLFVGGHIGWQVYTLDIQDPEGCLRKFKSNMWLGWLYLMSIILGRFVWF